MKISERPVIINTLPSISNKTLIHVRTRCTFNSFNMLRSFSMRVILILHPRCIGRCIAIVKLFQWEIKLISYFHLAGYVSARYVSSIATKLSTEVSCQNYFMPRGHETRLTRASSALVVRNAKTKTPWHATSCTLRD